ncbi:MAG: conjugal transfer protein TraB [Ahrensia sp.]
MTRDILGRFLPPVFSALRTRFSSSSRDIGLSTGLVVAAIAVGVIAWSGEVLALPLACVFPLLWALAPTRFVAAMVAASYFLAASRDLPQGAATFLEIGVTQSIGLWLAASASFVLIHTVLWTSKSGWRRAVRYCVVSILMAVPPFGITGWAGPITAAGVLFPGWGLYGLAATMIGLVSMTARLWPIAALAMGGAWFWSVATWTEPMAPDGWIGIGTSFDYSDKGKANGFEQHRTTIAMVRQAADEGYSVIVLPESAFGTWTPTTESLWIQNLEGTDAAVLGGASVLDAEGYDNVVIKVTATGSEILYRQRMPVPVAMWRPWSAGGAKAQFFRNPVVTVQDRWIAPLICSEHLLVWPILQSMARQPEILVAIGNGWWAQGTGVVAIQVAQLKAWAALFDIKLVYSFNEISDRKN